MDLPLADHRWARPPRLVTGTWLGLTDSFGQVYTKVQLFLSALRLDGFMQKPIRTFRYQAVTNLPEKFKMRPISEFCFDKDPDSKFDIKIPYSALFESVSSYKNSYS